MQSPLTIVRPLMTCNGKAGGTTSKQVSEAFSCQPCLSSSSQCSSHPAAATSGNNLRPSLHPRTFPCCPQPWLLTDGARLQHAQPLPDQSQTSETSLSPPPSCRTTTHACDAGTRSVDTKTGTSVTTLASSPSSSADKRMTARKSQLLYHHSAAAR